MFSKKINIEYSLYESLHEDVFTVDNYNHSHNELYTAHPDFKLIINNNYTSFKDLKDLVFPETNEFLDEASIKGKLATLAKGVQSGKVSKEYLADAVAKSEAVTGFSNIDVQKRTI